MNLNLSGKTAIFTGASRGIEKSIAQTLSAEGMKLTLELVHRWMNSPLLFPAPACLYPLTFATLIQRLA